MSGVRIILSIACLLITIGRLAGQIPIDGSVSFDSSNLPILFIDTQGQEIVDDPRIPARLRVINNEPGERNRIADPVNGYDGTIMIETRGSFAQSFPKKSYRFETHDEQGNDLNTRLLDMPRENDWILYAPFIDLSMIRNVMVYGLSNDMGRYASRTRFCEVVLNGVYEGVYVLMEKIKRDDDRVDISAMDADDVAADSLTGGYIIKIDKENGENVGRWFSQSGLRYQYDYPKPDRIEPEQEAYIQAYMNDFESIMSGDQFADPVQGYASKIDVDSFVDFFILNETFRNIDAYRISTFLHKDRNSIDPRLKAGPIWDFNLSTGMAFFGQDFFLVRGWVVDYNETHPNDGFQVPFWWIKLAHDEAFMRRVSNRWHELRGGILHLDTLYQRIDTLLEIVREARIRNQARWGDEMASLIDRMVPRPYDYAADSVMIKQWLEARLGWIDEQLAPLYTDQDRPEHPSTALMVLEQGYPNPFRAETRFDFYLPESAEVRIEVFDLFGRKVREIKNTTVPAGHHNAGWDGRNQNGSRPASGSYFIRMQAEIGGRLHSVTRNVFLVR